MLSEGDRKIKRMGGGKQTHDFGASGGRAIGMNVGMARIEATAIKRHVHLLPRFEVVDLCISRKSHLKRGSLATACRQRALRDVDTLCFTNSARTSARHGRADARGLTRCLRAVTAMHYHTVSCHVLRVTDGLAK